MKITEKLAGIDIDIEVPDALSGIAVGGHVTISVKTEQELDTVVATLGGVEAFGKINPESCYLTLRRTGSESIGVMVLVPPEVARSGEEKPTYPLMTALRGLQAQAEQREEQPS